MLPVSESDADAVAGAVATAAEDEAEAGDEAAELAAGLDEADVEEEELLHAARAAPASRARAGMATVVRTRLNKGGLLATVGYSFC